MLRPNGDNAFDTTQAGSTTSIMEPSLKQSKETGSGFPLRKSISHNDTHKDRRRTRIAMQQVISARQQKIYEQQCEIDELHRRIRDVCSDNKFLREQNYWQAKALEKLDGKHAELPQLINGHLEEIRVFREQLRRMKEVLKVEKQRRHDAENSKDKGLCELKHLRKLADDQNLLEREELMQTMDRIQAENDEKGKLLINMGRYAENLEKNLHSESLRSTKSQKSLRDSCQRLLDRIHELEQIVQEKQKIIELGHIYSKRTLKNNAVTNSSLEICSPSTQDSTNLSNETVPSEVDHGKGCLRERIKEFDQRRQDMERKKDKTRRRRCNYGRSGDEPDFDPSLDCIRCTQGAPLPHGVRPALSHSDDDGEQEEIGEEEERREEEETEERTMSSELEQVVKSRLNYSTIVLPKIKPSDKTTEIGGRKNSNATQSSDQILEEVELNELQANERLSRLLAEANLERNTSKRAGGASQLLSGEITSGTDLIYCLKAISRVSKPPLSDSGARGKSTGLQDLAKPDSYDSTIGSNNDTDGSMKRSIDLKNTITQSIEPLNMEGVQNNEKLSEQPRSPVQEAKIVEVTMQPLEQCRPESIAPHIVNSPQLPRMASELSHFDSFELIPLPDATKQICRPCGDHDIDAFLTEESNEDDSPATSDTMANAADEDFMWQDTPSVPTASSLYSSRMVSSRLYRGPNGLLSNGHTDMDTMDIEYITEAAFGLGPTRYVGSGLSDTQGNDDLPLLNCAPRTNLLHTMINSCTDYAIAEGK